ncbi:MAG: hypothetical protein ACRC7N_11165 [Clostridium sp.]
MAILNIFNEDLRCTLGFFGTPLGTNAINTTISPYTDKGGTVISTNPNSAGSVFSSWSSVTGGWSNWNPSPSIIPPTAKVKYAFLVWSTAYWPTPITTPPYEQLGNLPSVVLTKPDGTSIPVAPNPTYHQTSTLAGNWWQYTNGADITSIMQDNQYGKYTVTGIPTGAYSTANGLGGWGLYILYTDNYLPYNNVNLNVCATGFNNTVTISNLMLPITGPVSIGIYLSSVQGDKGYADSLLLNGVKLSGPFNPPNDFMNDKYVDYTGLALQTIGSLLDQNAGLSQYGYYADQTYISNNNILTNTTTDIVLYQDNSKDWAGISFWGIITALNSALIINKKYVNKDYATPGDTIIYTLEYTNTGSTQTLNTVVIDTLPSDLTFIPNSIFINSIPLSGNITEGITLPNIQPLQTLTLSFSAQVSPLTKTPSEKLNSAFVSYDFLPGGTTLVNFNASTNIVTTTIISVTLAATKYVDKSSSSIGDVITYTFVLVNTGSLAQTNINFFDTLPTTVSLIPNSLNQDGIPFSYSTSGMILPKDVLPNTFSTITFQVEVLDDSINPITNFGTFIGSSTISNLTLTTTAPSNTVVTSLSRLTIESQKYVDKEVVKTGEAVLYTLTFTNTGNIQANNLVFIDTLPTGAVFINNTLTLNGALLSGANPNLGVPLGAIKPSETITITFKATLS